MKTITEKQLEIIVRRINEVTGSPLETYVDGKAQMGNYHLYFRNGGVGLDRIQNDGAGTVDVLGCGTTTKRDLIDRMHAYLKGLADGRTSSPALVRLAERVAGLNENYAGIGEGMLKTLVEEARAALQPQMQEDKAIALLRKLSDLCPTPEGLGGHAPLEAFLELGKQARAILNTK